MNTRTISGLVVFSLVCPFCAAAFAQAPAAATTREDTAAAKPGPTKTKKSPKLHIAFFQLEAQGVEQKAAAIVSDSVLIEMTKLPDTTVIGSKEIDAMLGFEQKKQMSGCTDTSCIVAIGGALGVDKILLGTVGKLGSSHVFNLKLLNVRAGTIETMFNKRLKGGNEEDFLDMVPEALSEIFPESAAVWAKGSNATSRHSVTSGKPVIIKEALPAGASVWPWVLVGGGAAAAIGGGVTHYLAFGDYDSFKSTPETDPKREDLKSSAGLKQTIAFVLYGAGAAAAAGGLIWYYLAGGAPAKTGGIQIGPMVGTPGLVVEGGW